MIRARDKSYARRNPLGYLGRVVDAHRADQLLTTLDWLERMEKHYLRVSKLDAQEVQRGFEASEHHVSRGWTTACATTRAIARESSLPGFAFRSLSSRIRKRAIFGSTGAASERRASAGFQLSPTLGAVKRIVNSMISDATGPD